MSKKEKLIARFLTMPKNFHFSELEKLLGYWNYKEVKKGKTSGSRVKFMNGHNDSIILHKPHPDGNLKLYHLKRIKEKLEL